MEELSLAGLFGAAFLASTLLPGGSEAVVGIMLHQQSAPVVAIWLVATAGNTAGAMLGWLLGHGGRWLRDPEASDNPRVRRALAWVRRHGAPALVMSWLPVVGDPLCLAAGWLGIRALPALLWICVGKGLRYAALIVLLQAGGIAP